jgi:hypothetical protein
VDWLEILGLGASAASGGLFGVLGAAFGSWMKHKERKQKALDQQAEREHELKLIELKMQSNSQEGAWDGLTTSIQAQRTLDSQTTNNTIVVGIKSLFRPFLTLFLWLAVAWMMNLVLTGQLNLITQEATLVGNVLFTTAELTALMKYIVYSTVFSATTATTWWFGERALSLPEMKNR